MLDDVEVNDLHRIFMNNLKVVPKAYDMHGENFNCDCHLETTDNTYKLIANRFNASIEDAINIVDKYLLK